jgi:hypothetical protein
VPKQVVFLLFKFPLPYFSARFLVILGRWLEAINSIRNVWFFRTDSPTVGKILTSVSTISGVDFSIFPLKNRS